LFKWLSTGLSTAHTVKLTRERVTVLEELVAKLTADVARVTEAHDLTYNQLHKLRGKVYGEAGAAQRATSLPATREERRIQALAARGIVPGRPVNLEE